MTEFSSGAESLDMLRSWIYLTGILPLLEDVVRYDGEARSAITSRDVVVQFEVKHGPVAHLGIANESIRYGAGAHPRPDVRLTFRKPQQLNLMFAGEQIRPGLRKGFRHLGFLLRQFPTLASRLSYYLEGAGSEAPEGDKEAQRFLVGLRLRALVGGTAAVAGHDTWLSDVAERTPSGKLLLEVLPDGPRGVVEKAVHNGEYQYLAGFEEEVDHPNAIMQLNDLEVARRILEGEMGLEEAASLGDARFAGNISLAVGMGILIRRLVTVMGF